MSSSSASALPRPRKLNHQPYWSEDPGLDPAYGTTPYFLTRGLIERAALEISYPEIRNLNHTGTPYDYVFPEEFLKDPRGSSSLSAAPYLRPDNTVAAQILGSVFNRNPSSPFDNFLFDLLQHCRMYNSCLYELRWAFYRRDVDPNATPPVTDPELDTAIQAYRVACDHLWDYLTKHDKRLPEGANSRFEKLAVDLMKVNGYIFSVRAAATEKDSIVQDLFSSSSHIIMSDMYGPPRSSSSSGSPAASPVASSSSASAGL